MEGGVQGMPTATTSADLVDPVDLPKCAKVGKVDFVHPVPSFPFLAHLPLRLHPGQMLATPSPPLMSLGSSGVQNSVGSESILLSPISRSL